MSVKIRLIKRGDGSFNVVMQQNRRGYPKLFIGKAVPQGGLKAVVSKRLQEMGQPKQPQLPAFS